MTYKGVVFNEMKGVYSSPDSVFYRSGERLVAGCWCSRCQPQRLQEVAGRHHTRRSHMAASPGAAFKNRGRGGGGVSSSRAACLGATPWISSGWWLVSRTAAAVSCAAGHAAPASTAPSSSAPSSAPSSAHPPSPLPPYPCRAVQQALFPDNTYRHDSGGDPQQIPGLTYEEFQQFHGKYYHPSNARWEGRSAAGDPAGWFAPTPNAPTLAPACAPSRGCCQAMAAPGLAQPPTRPTPCLAGVGAPPPLNHPPPPFPPSQVLVLR
jgi:hypothetical protein